MNTIDYIELIKKNNRINGKPCSDYRAAQIIGINRSAIARYKTEGRQMDDNIAVKVAKLLDLEPAVVLMDMQIERATDPEIKRAYKKINAILQQSSDIAPDDKLSQPIAEEPAVKTLSDRPTARELILCKIDTLSGQTSTDNKNHPLSPPAKLTRRSYDRQFIDSVRQ